MKLSRVPNPPSTITKPPHPPFVSTIKNQHVQAILDLVLKKSKTLQVLHRISYILEQLLEFEYFKLLKSKLNEIDYLTVIQKLMVSCRERGSVVIEKRRRNDYFYVVLHGEVEVLDEVVGEGGGEEGEGGNERRYEMINTLFKGDTFGESSLVNSKRQTKARVQAKTPTVLLLLPFDIFNKTILKITIMRKQQIVNLFSKSSLFIDIDQDSLKDLASEIYEFRFGLNETIYSQGSKYDHFYFIKNGAVEIFENGVKLVTLPAGEYFGIEGRVLEEGRVRRQAAVSRASDLVVYKVVFSRLVKMNHYEDRFLRNLGRDFEGKESIYRKLITNHKKVEKLISNHSISQKIAIKRRRPKVTKPPLQPVWWGVSRRMNELNHKSQPHTEDPNDKGKQNICSKSGLLGEKRINFLRHSIFAKEEEQEKERENSISPSFSSSVLGSLPQSLLKKIVKKNIRSSDAELLKKKLIPEIQRNKLLKYAKSGVDTCETMFYL